MDRTVTRRMDSSCLHDCLQFLCLSRKHRPCLYSDHDWHVWKTQLFICTPVSRVWDIEAQPDGCINAAMFMVISGAINVVTDIVLLIFPLPLIWVIKFNKRQRSKSTHVWSCQMRNADHGFSGSSSHSLYRRHPSCSQFHASLRDCHVWQSHQTRKHLARSGFQLVRPLPMFLPY